MERAAAFHEAKWRMYKRRKHYEKAKHHAARARYYRAAFGTGKGQYPWFQSIDPPADEHRLCVMSYFEFQNRDVNESGNGAYIHKWAAHETDVNPTWQCPFHEALMRGVKNLRLLDFDVTNKHIENLVYSLRNTTQWVNNSNSEHDFSERQESVTNREYYEFGFNDVLGWLLPPQMRGFPPHVDDVRDYLNSLVVEGCTQVKGQWLLTIGSTKKLDVAHLNIKNPPHPDFPGIFCRGTPKPQRAMDVIPIILRVNQGGAITEVQTIVGTRNASQVGMRMHTGLTMNINKDGCSNGHQVGAGEHLEAGEYKAAASGSAQLSKLQDVPIPTLRTYGGLKGPVVRALKEEVGLPQDAIEAGKVFLIGNHTTNGSSKVGRDARYWPRVTQDGLVYGYPRETSTILSAIVIRYPASIKLKCAQDDTSEVKSTRAMEWNDALFKPGPGPDNLKPAFGYAHEMMVKWVDSCLEDMINEYIRYTLILGPFARQRGTKRSREDGHFAGPVAASGPTRAFSA
jgi:hypothetical protein